MDQHVYTRNREGKITSYTSEEYYSNGQISLQFSSNPYMLKTFYENGCLSGITTKDTKTCYFKNGKIQSVITKTPKQGINEYVEYTEEGNIKKKGLIEQPHGFEGGISNFITGNMEEKKKDESRQKFNDIIEAFKKALFGMFLILDALNAYIPVVPSNAPSPKYVRSSIVKTLLTPEKLTFVFLKAFFPIDTIFDPL